MLAAVFSGSAGGLAGGVGVDEGVDSSETAFWAGLLGCSGAGGTGSAAAVGGAAGLGTGAGAVFADDAGSSGVFSTGSVFAMLGGVLVFDVETALGAVLAGFVFAGAGGFSLPFTISRFAGSFLAVSRRVEEERADSE